MIFIERTCLYGIAIWKNMGIESCERQNWENWWSSLMNSSQLPKSNSSGKSINKLQKRKATWGKLEIFRVWKFTHLAGPIIIQCHSLKIYMNWMSRKILYLFLPFLRKKGTSTKISSRDDELSAKTVLGRILTNWHTGQVIRIIFLNKDSHWKIKLEDSVNLSLIVC